jgi:hypothetical protein
MGVTDLVAALGGGAFVLASLVLGARLMLLARRTRGLSELILGAALFLMGGVSYLLTTIAIQGTSLPRGVRVGMAVAHMILNGVGMTGIAIFTRRVFRPHADWALAATFAAGAGYAGAAAAQILGPGFDAFLTGVQGPWRASQLVAIGVPIWSGAEALRYHAMLRRRLRLGLAEPSVVERFLLWGSAMWLASFLTFCSMVLEAAGIPVIGTLTGALLVGPLGLGIAALLWLAFFPPRAYLAWVEQRAARLV